MNQTTTDNLTPILADTTTNRKEIKDRTPLQPPAQTHGFPHVEQVVVYVAASAAEFGGGAGAAALLCRVDAEGGHLKDPMLIGARNAAATAPRMEMLAAILGLGALKASAGLPVILRSRSEALVRGLNEWMPGWKAQGWKKADRKAPENLPEWQAIDLLISTRTVGAERPEEDRWTNWVAEQARGESRIATQEFLNG